MKTYIINLLSATERKQHMNNITKQNVLLEPVFVEAVDGRAMSDEEKQTAFNREKSFSEYGRTLRSGEIGVALSHYKIYSQMIDEKDKYSIVFEDDVECVLKINDELLSILKPYYDSNVPTVILLSGWYEYYKQKKLNDNYKIASVFDAWLACGYIINNKAAEIILNEKPFWLADDWWLFKSKGVRVFGIKPHIIDTLPRDIMPSYVQINNEPSISHIRKNMSIYKSIKSYYRFGVRKLFKFVGLSEPERLRK